MKKLFRHLLFLLFIASFSSCVLATFDRYPGEKLNGIPARYQGNYKYLVAKKDMDREDSTVLILNQDSWEVKGPDEHKKYYLGDSVVISQYQGYDFVSVKTANRKYWFVYIARLDKDVLHTYPVIVKNKRRKNIERFLEAAPADSSQAQQVFKMNEPGLLRYYEKVLKKRKTVKLKKVQS